MRATALEFRLRMVILILIVVLGFLAPWIEYMGHGSDLGQRISLLEWLALELSRTGLMRFTYATPVVIVAAALFAAAGMILRVWGTAYLGYGTVHHARMQAGELIADGPYRHVRNPLYLGGWFMMAAIAFIMPPAGALFAMPLLTLFYLRLIFAEEAFLTDKLGQRYRDYLRAVPRLIPRLRSPLPAAGQKPHWGTALLTELNPIGVFIILAVLSWRYDNELMLKALLVSLGVSLVVKALAPRNQAGPHLA